MEENVAELSLVRRRRSEGLGRKRESRGEK